jgi:glycosyltransferase involved in cell wall biosynthesis
MGDQKKIRILFLIARLNIGGPSVVTITLTEKLSMVNYETMLVCGHVGPYEGDMSYLAQAKGVHPLFISGLGRDISPSSDFRAFGKLLKVVREFDPHIIHTHTAKAGTLGRLVGALVNLGRVKHNRIRLVHTFHGHVFHSYFSPISTSVLLNIEKILGRFTDQFVAISPLQKKEICHRFQVAESRKTRVIPLGLDLSPYANVKNTKEDLLREYFPDAPGDVTLVGIVGRLTPVKNHRMLLEAIQILKGQGRDHLFRFLVVGGGELRGTLESQVRHMKLEQKVAFTGWQMDMARMYGSLDIAVTTSLNEGTPATIIEAMAAGRPIVATQVGGIPDLLGKIDKHVSDGYKLAQNGVLIPSRNSRALAEAIFLLGKEKGLSGQMAKQAYAFAHQRFTLERMVSEHDSLYRSLLCGSSELPS